METVARFITRDNGTGKADLMIGVMFQRQDALKPNRVYEIRECMGQLMIVDIGECIIGDCPPTSRNLEGVPHWGYSIEGIILEMGKHLYLTREEYKKALG